MHPWIDSHCHLNYPELFGDFEATLRNAAQANVRGLLTICTDLEQFDEVYAIAESRPWIWSSLGIHPHEAEPSIATRSPEEVYKILVDKARLPKVVGLGETGLDYYYEHSPRAEQISLFRAHCDASLVADLPVIVHTRDAESDTLEILRSYDGKLRGVIHCFTGTLELAKGALDLGFMISISGVVTFKKSQALRDIVELLPLDRLLLETDAPYLAPEPYRGQANQPAYMVRTAEVVADVKTVSLAHLSQHTTQNFFRLFTRASYDAIT